LPQVPVKVEQDVRLIMKKLVLFALGFSSFTQAYTQQVCGPRFGERWCTHVCCLSDAYGELRCRITNFRRHDMMNACATNDLAREIAPLFAGKHSHELACIVEYVFTEQDQALRFALSKALSYKDGHRLNTLWYMIFNPEIIEQPYEQDYVVVYNAIGLLRKAFRENNMRLQLKLIEKLGFYFENRTIDFIAPLMKIALTKQDHFFVELMNLYLRPYESLNMLVVWDYLFNPVKTAYNLADECEQAAMKRKLEEELKRKEDEIKKFEKHCSEQKFTKVYDPAHMIAGKLKFPAVSPEKIHNLHDHADIYYEKMAKGLGQISEFDANKNEEIKEKILKLDAAFDKKIKNEAYTDSQQHELMHFNPAQELDILTLNQAQEVQSVAESLQAKQEEFIESGHESQADGFDPEAARLSEQKVAQGFTESVRRLDDEKKN
jgi:hypothetical protein